MLRLSDSTTAPAVYPNDHTSENKACDMWRRNLGQVIPNFVWILWLFFVAKIYCIIKIKVD